MDAFQCIGFGIDYFDVKHPSINKVPLFSRKAGNRHIPHLFIFLLAYRYLIIGNHRWYWFIAMAVNP
ncbi:hypothetical protein WAJ58_25915, partial [Acinetobacter baumannii]